MILRDLRAFLLALEMEGGLRRVTAEVDPDLEIAAVTDRVSKGRGGGAALLFSTVRGHTHAVATNLFGSARRMALALGGEDLDDVGMRFAEGIRTGSGSLSDRLGRMSSAPRRVANPLCREVVEEGRGLESLPALRNWPGDVAPFLTLPLVFTSDPEGGDSNCGMYRVQIFDGRTAAIHWGERSGGAAHYRRWSRRRERMPAVIALGGPPSLTWAAAAPLPPGACEVSFAGWIMGEGIETVRSLTCDIEVPASAEFVLEGYLEPGELRPEGPFGNHTGFYAPPAPAPVFHLERLTRRSNPVLPCTVVGPPPTENLWFARATERLLLPLLQEEIPELAGLHFLTEGAFHGCALLSVAPGGRGGEVIRKLWNTPFLAAARLLVAVDSDLCPQERSRILWRLINQVDPDRDLLIQGGRLGIDGTRKGDEARVVPDSAVLRKMEERWKDYGID